MTIPNTTECHANAVLNAGGYCHETQSDKGYNLNFREYQDFLEATADHSAAICRSANDFVKQKTAMEQACRELGSKCSYELKQTIDSMNALMLR